jgi:hypothetical protein
MKHYKRWHAFGDPTAAVAFIRGDDDARFWSKVNKNGPVPEHRPELGPCWVWTGSLHINPRSPQHSYGSFQVDGRGVTATRYLLSVIDGIDLRDDQQVCHRCDNAVCVNRDHLFVGTRDDNMRDMAIKGRTGCRVLTEDQVRDIRVRYGTAGATQAKLAAEFGVSASTIGDIVTRRTWAHLTVTADVQV